MRGVEGEVRAERGGRGGRGGGRVGGLGGLEGELGAIYAFFFVLCLYLGFTINPFILVLHFKIKLF